MNTNEIASAIKWHRENLNYSSKYVASHLNLSQSIYSKLENSKREITVSEINNLSKLFNLTIDEILKAPFIE
ncbi:helix-turn-helix transcriptional regulator [Macrococcoides canis]|uniref:helix-turn-helix domain-containing protein n=1 Tax=Macrococcoides canis TaxID=1855823 RepID=UPI0020B8ADDA|nr:helix-turn-helix transcriptional regulator [Macrococcus canis]UTH01828.1 helix-turn-helix transcriptional regulator [Macrococcus canis]